MPLSLLKFHHVTWVPVAQLVKSFVCLDDKCNYYVVDTKSLNYYRIINKIFQDLALSYDPVFTVENLKSSLCFFHLGLGPLIHLIPKSLHF